MKRLAFVAILLAPALAVADAKSFNSGKGATVDCSKDPEVNINHGKGTYVFKRRLQGDHGQRRRQQADDRERRGAHVNGGKNAIDVGAVDTINVVGAGNTVTYKKTVKGDKVDVNAVGDGNKVGKG